MGALRQERRGRKALLPLATLLHGLVFHFLCGAGTLAEHLRQLTGQARAESTLAERRAALDWEIFCALLRQALRPLAHGGRHAEAFWCGWRLVAWDGVQFSLTNTPQVQAQRPKAKSRRGQAAWAKITAVVLLELGLHNPLAAAVGWRGESEYALTPTLLAALPRHCLLLADRLSGVPALLAPSWDACQARDSHFLIRARASLLVHQCRRLRDGSALITVAVRDPRRPRRILRFLQLREIYVRIQRPGGRSEVLRLWTSLLDPATAPALALARLYAQRWEHELYWRQMKQELRRGDLLQSHTPETAAQEIVMLILATALLARERWRIAAGQRPVLAISFLKCLELLRPLWLVLSLARDVLSAEIRRALVRIFEAEMRRCRKPKRRARSCLRAVRQPVTGWPRLLNPKYAHGKAQLKLLARPPRSRLALRRITERHYR